MLPLDEDFLFAISPSLTTADAQDTQARHIEMIAGQYARLLDEFEINSPLRVAHFSAQICYESRGFASLQDPVASLDSEAASVAHTASDQEADLEVEALAASDLEHQYEPGHSEQMYRGRGLIRLTGKSHYQRSGERLGLPLEDHPEMALEPVIALKIACEYWSFRRVNLAADQDDVIRVTRLMNGDLAGLDERRLILQRAKKELARLSGLRVALSQNATQPVLRLGSRGELVVELQQLLSSEGYGLCIDGDFGPATQLAVEHWQANHDLVMDALVGQETWNSLGG